MRMKRGFTDEELNVLESHFEKSSKEEMLKLLPNRMYSDMKRTYRLQIASKKNEKPKSYRRAAWSPEEIKTLEDNYPYMIIGDLEKILPGRSRSSINQRAFAKGLKKDPITMKQIEEYSQSLTIDKRHDRWSKVEINILKEKYAKHGVQGCKKLLPGRTERAIKTKIKSLNLTGTFQTSWEAKSISVSNDDIFSVTINFERSDKI